MSKQTTSEELERIITMRREGATLSQIGLAVGKSVGVVHKLVSRHGVVPGGPPVTEEALAATGRRMLLGQLTKKKTIKSLSDAQQVGLLRVLSKGTGGRRNRVPKAPVHFTPIDLSFARAVPCSSCGEYPATEAHPVCVRCAPDTPFDVANEGKVGEWIRMLPCKSCGQNNQTGGGVCNSCRLSAPVMAVGAEGVGE